MGGLTDVLFSPRSYVRAAPETPNNEREESEDLT
jgi:hypothetical protein